MFKIILARHAETIWNEQLRYIGVTDLELSPLGLKNAGLLAGHLSGSGPGVVFSSDMRRAVQTAAAVAGPLGLDVVREPLLNEIDFGRWEGLTHDEIVAAFPRESAEWIRDPFTVDIPGGEPWPHFAARVRRGWQNIIEPPRTGTVLLVTHAGVIKTILGAILDLSSDEWWRIYQDKGALNHLVVDGDRVRISRVNDTDYRRSARGEEPAAADMIRRCEASDGDRIHKVIAKSAGAYEPLTREDVKRELERMTFYGVDFAGLLMGVIGYEPLEGLVLVRHAYVLPACQRQGWGSRLLQHVEAQAQADGYGRLLVGTYAENKAAIDFYKQHGFEPVSDSQALLAAHWDVPEDQARCSLVLAKTITRLS